MKIRRLSLMAILAGLLAAGLLLGPVLHRRR